MPFKYLSYSIEYIINKIKKNLDISWGWTVIFFSILVNFTLYPVNILVDKIQENVNLISSKLKPTLKEIKRNYDGEDAHNKIMQEYRINGVTPFYTLKPMLGLFVKIPILISIFNVLAQMPQFHSQSFAWFDDLAYPDAIFLLATNVPFLGQDFNLLPVFMTLIAILSAFFYNNQYLTEYETKIAKTKLYIIALLFLVVFYPFPAVMVLYWTMANILHFSNTIIKGIVGR
nr:membrane protein insertase YidC [Vibrio hepatarius]